MKLPRNVSGARLQASLRRLGYETVRQRGSHVRITTQVNGEHHEVIPLHTPIRVKTLSRSFSVNSTCELSRHSARALEPYPAYKDSRIAWLGEVPEHWQVRRLKTLCSRSALYGANVAATSYTTAGVRFLRTTDITEDGQLNGRGVFLPQESVDNYLLADGDVLISRSGTIGRSFLYERRIHGPCAYAGYLVRFVPAPIALPKYILLFTKTHAFAGFLRVKAISSTIENVNGEKYANCPLPRSMRTDTSERGLERLICTALAGHPCDPPAGPTVGDPPAGYAGVGWSGGNPDDYNREFCVDRVQLAAFLRATQPEAAESLALDENGPTRRRFLARLQGEISRRGTIDVLRHGLRHGAHDLDIFYGTPSPGNVQAQERFEQNRFTVVRQLRYSRDETQRALDIGLFINGLPVFTFELKNSLTKQTVSDAVWQYQKDRNPREKLFEFGRCVAHFAVDESDVRFCTHLKGKASWFLPFNRGWNDGAGNPPNPSGIKTDYLWREVLTRESLTDILENYAQVVEAKDEKTGKKKRTQIWPRYQQLDVVRRLLADAATHGAGRRYLIQHSAGSGKSNSIAWLAHQLIGLAKDDASTFDSIIVVTDRRILDRQIRDTIKQYAQVGATVGHAERAGDLRRFIEAGKKIIISTVQKFPFILDEIGNEQRGQRFAIIIDEAHSSQGGRTSASISAALGTAGEEAEEETTEDHINRLMESRKLLPNASYFAFTATPKNKTLEIFGAPDPQPGGAVRHHAFHSYTMKQAIQEGFILDVLAHYAPVASYYRLAKTVEDDPEFDVKKAQKKLRRFVEGHDHAIRLKAEIMVDHFHEQVIAKNKIGGEARTMVVTNGIERAIQYFHAIRDYLQERKSQYRAIVAFSGEPEFGGEKVTEASLNGFPSGQIADKIQQDSYRSKGILDAIDMDSYRVEKRAVQQILLPDENAEIEPVPPSGGGHVPEPELERLSSILREFNDLFGAIAWQDTDRVKEMITETIPFRVAQDAAFKNAHQNSDQDNARIEHGKALTRVMTALIKDDAELFKQFMDNDSFKRWMTETVFGLACKQAS